MAAGQENHHGHGRARGERRVREGEGKKGGGSLQFVDSDRQTGTAYITYTAQAKKNQKKEKRKKRKTPRASSAALGGGHFIKLFVLQPRRVILHESLVCINNSLPQYKNNNPPPFSLPFPSPLPHSTHGPATHMFIPGIQTITFASAGTYAPFASSSGTTAPVSV